MAITSIGYDGPITEPGLASLLPNSGGMQWGVIGAGDWAVTPHPSTAQALNIAPGVGWGPGVIDTSNAIETIQCDPISLGQTRWDLIAMRRNWQPAGGQSRFVAVKGTSAKGLPGKAVAPTPLSNTQRQVFPGIVEDQPLALVQWTGGQSQPTAVVDLRLWGANGGMVAKSDLVLTYLDRVGSTVTIEGDVWQCTLGANDTMAWTKSTRLGRIPLLGAGSTLVGGVPPQGTDFLVQAGTVAQQSDPNGYARLTYPTPFPNGVLTVQITPGDTSTDRAWWNAPMSYGIAGGWAPVGDRNDFVYGLMTMNPGGGIRLWGNQWHRINWLAIGW
ncbi:hypothetical protein [Sinomonas sp. ASV322]|uniref:hypothetical protein n=1 Tax=Sinomonas sp. ASV322 TaxID=3041920 RepID=UPI0027DC4639|nr:hypothetical protein [Sinomonas sp. ASV322]MDQ4502189.1 hypothetical protein [Sinomonas sp. ASV322]